MSSDLTNKLPPGSGGLIQVWAKKIDGYKLDMLGEKKGISSCRCYFCGTLFLKKGFIFNLYLQENKMGGGQNLSHPNPGQF